MTWGGKVLVYVFGGLVLALHVKAMAPDSGESPYRGIVERNVFGLKPPTVAEAPAPPPPPPVKITLTGITTILGNKRALLSAQPPNKPPEFYMLTEGQRQDDIEVLEINEDTSTVRLSNHGIPQTLDFQNDGAKRQNVPPPALPPPMSGSLPPPPGLPTPPGGIPAQPQNPNPTPLRTIPTRTMRLPPPQNPTVAPPIPEAPTEQSGAAQP